MFEVVNPEGLLLKELEDKRIRRGSVAITYALCIKSSVPIDWKRINLAITERWSQAGLIYVKERAWKIVKGKIQS